MRWMLLSVSGVDATLPVAPGYRQHCYRIFRSTVGSRRWSRCSSRFCRRAEANRSKKWLLTCPLMPTRPRVSADGEPSAIVAPSGRTSRVQINERSILPRLKVRAIFADQPAAARYQYLAPVEPANVACDECAGRPRTCRVERGTQGPPESTCLARPSLLGCEIPSPALGSPRSRLALPFPERLRACQRKPLHRPPYCRTLAPNPQCPRAA